jgi:hypothetical protein
MFFFFFELYLSFEERLDNKGIILLGLIVRIITLLILKMRTCSQYIYIHETQNQIKLR